VRQVDRQPEECEKWCREFPHLRIIDDETFGQAQRLLDENAEANRAFRQTKARFRGSKPGSAGRHPRHLLAQLIVCGHCGRTFYVGGRNGRYLFCPGYHMGVCSCQTQLLRKRAEKMILAEIGRRILANTGWRQLVFEETQRAWDAQQATLPSELAAARKGLTDVEQKIVNLVDRIEDGLGGPELNERLAQRRSAKRDLLDRIAKLEQADQARPPAPTEAWIDQQLEDLGNLLMGGTPAAAYALRNLVGGRVVVTEIRQPGRQRYHLEGRFTVTTRTVAAAVLGSSSDDEAGRQPETTHQSEEIVIEFREPPQIESLSERAKQLYDQGMMNARIAKELGCARNYVTRLLKFWFESRGLTMPDGRSRRKTLQEKHLEPPVYRQIAEDVMRQYGEGVLLQDIANAMQVDRNTITAVVRWWHASLGLPVPDGRTRRKSLDVKASVAGEECQAEPPAEIGRAADGAEAA
jgi:hypothetical protein